MISTLRGPSGVASGRAPTGQIIWSFQGSTPHGHVSGGLRGVSSALTRNTKMILEYKFVAFSFKLN